MYKDLKDIVLSTIFISLLIFAIKACNNEKGMIKYSIDTIYEYYNYADSLFNK